MAAPSPSGGVDASSFPSVFSSKVSTLLHADRRAIAALTQLADEHRQQSKVVVDLIGERMRQLPSGDHRLPLFYLIDSICQNLGPKGSDYPKRFQQHLKRMFESTVKRCSKKHQGSLYRMWSNWKLKRVFNSKALEEIEEILNQYLTPEERTAALNRPSSSMSSTSSSSLASNPAEDRKRGATTESDPAAKKKMKLHDPRRPTPSPPAAAATSVTPSIVAPPPTSFLPPPPPTSAPMDAETSSAATVLSQIISSPDIASRADLRPLISRIQADMARPLMGVEEMKAMIAQAVAQLQEALLAPPPPPPAPAQPSISAPPVPSPPAVGMGTYPPPPSMSMRMPLPPPPSAPPSFPPPTQPMAHGPGHFPPPPTHMPSYGAYPPPPNPSAAPSGWPGMAHLPRGGMAPLPPPPAAAAPPAEVKQPVTFDEDDLKTRRPWVISSLYHSIPFQCKTCGLRIHSSEEMSSHLDWHFAMSKRAATIDKQGEGTRFQTWYWKESEWIEAKDVVFGVQKKIMPGMGGAAAQAGGATGAGGADDSEAAGAGGEEQKEAPPVIADENQKSCPVCSEEFKSGWSDEEESWLYLDAIRLTPDFLTEAQQQIAKLEAAKPEEGAEAASAGSGADAARAAKESARLDMLFRMRAVLEHVQTHLHQILHAHCHRAVIQSCMKKQRSEGTSENTAAGKLAAGQQDESKMSEIPALE